MKRMKLLVTQPTNERLVAGPCVHMYDHLLPNDNKSRRTTVLQIFADLGLVKLKPFDPTKNEEKDDGEDQVLSSPTLSGLADALDKWFLNIKPPQILMLDCSDIPDFDSLCFIALGHTETPKNELLRLKVECKATFGPA